MAKDSWQQLRDLLDGSQLDQLSPQEQFDSLIKYFTECRDKDSADRVALNAIKVMKSGIFYQGGLRGAANPGGGLKHEIIPITGMFHFVYDLALSLAVSSGARDAEWIDKQVKKIFDKITWDFMGLIHFVKRAKGQRQSNKLIKAWQKLAELEQEIQSKPGSPHTVSIPVIKREISGIFIAHIQTSGSTKADRSAELLNAFGISATPEGMRDLLKKK